MAVISASDNAHSSRVDDQHIVSGLECRIGKAPIALPANAVAQIIEYDLASPAPLTSPWISGFGVHEGQVVVSVSLRANHSSLAPRRCKTKGILLHTPGWAGAGFAIEVSAVAALINLSVTLRPLSVSGNELPSWLSEAEALDGRRLGWINVAAMLADFNRAHGN